MIMKYLSICFGLLLIFSVILSGCKNQESTPQKVTLHFLTAIQQADYKEAKKYATKDSKDMLDALSSFQDMLSEQSLERFQKGKIAILDTKMRDSTAIVYYNSDKDSTRKTLNLKKENGKWKVSFTKETILPDFNQPAPVRDSVSTP